MSAFLKDFLSFPIRALFIFDRDRFRLTSLRTERFRHVAREVDGICLDVGCGPGNLFVKRFLKGKGKGVDVFMYEGLRKEDMVDPLKLPFRDSSFDTATLIAAINHIPKNKRGKELAEIFRILRTDGRIIVTMGNPIAEIIVHRLSRMLNKEDMDTKRGMDKDETCYIRDAEIKNLLTAAGFGNLSKKRFWSQWGLNHMIIGEKKEGFR